MATATRRTLTRTRAPIFSSLNRIVPHVAAANCVWVRPSLRSAHSSTYPRGTIYGDDAVNLPRIFIRQARCGVAERAAVCWSTLGGTTASGARFAHGTHRPPIQNPNSPTPTTEKNNAIS